MNNRLKIILYLGLGIITFVLIFNYVSEQAGDYLDKTVPNELDLDELSNFVAPISISNFIDNLNNLDNRTVDGHFSVTYSRYTYASYYELILVPKFFDDTVFDTLLEIIVNLDEGPALGPLLRAMNSNMNTKDIEDLVISLLNEEDFYQNAKGLEIKKEGSVLSVKRNMVY